MRTRRQAVSILIGAGLSICSSSCGRSNQSSLALATRKIKDIRTNSPVPIILAAKDIVALVPLTLYYDEGGHRHPYTVTKEHMKRLIAGEIVQITTEEVQGHRHTAILDPSRNPPNAAEIEVPDTTPELRNKHLALALDQGKQPKIHLRSDLQIDSASYCQAEEALCTNDPSFWRTLHESEAPGGIAQFVSNDALKLNLSDNPLQIRAKTKQGTGLWTTFRIKAK